MSERPFPPAPPLDEGAMGRARAHWDSRAKPPGALGRIEELGVHLAGVTGRCPPPVPRHPHIVVFAGDHGVVADGASAWPPEVTGAMLSVMSQQGAAINAFAEVIGAQVSMVDVGVAGPRGAVPGVRDERVRSGTGNIAREDAMTLQEAQMAVEVGMQLADERIDDGADALIGGEMGIGNTTSSAALIAAVAGASADAVTGAGAGAPPGGMQRKRELVEAALLRSGETKDPLHLLACLGGLEIAALAGLYLTAAARHTPFVLDGLIACAALCVAETLAPGTAAHAIAGHRSIERGATVALRHLQIEPLLNLGLRLGEGTGAALAFPLVQAAAGALSGMAGLPDEA